MDFLFIIVGGLGLCLSSFVIFEDRLKTLIEIFITFFISIILLSWVILAHVFKQPVISYHELKTIENNGNKTQIIMVDKNPVNVTALLGAVFEDGTIIERIRTDEVWSMGVFVVFGSTSYKVKEVE